MWLGHYWNLVGDHHGDEMGLLALGRGGRVSRDSVFLTASVKGREKTVPAVKVRTEATP